MGRSLVLAFLIAVLAPTLVFGKDTRDRKWSFGFLQGFAEHTILGGTDSLFRITCDVSASDEAAATKYGLLSSLDIRIRGEEPPANSTVLIRIDGRNFKFSTDEFRTIETFNRAARSRYHAMWRAMIKGRAMRVIFSDGRSLPFSLLGARDTLGPNPCDVVAFEGASENQDTLPEAE